MKSLLLEKYIKKAIRRALKEQEEQIRKQEKSIYLIFKYPGLKEAMINLMSPSFTRFITDVGLVSPKPTTFNIVLTNGLDFYLTHLGKNKFSAKIRGKKYDLSNLSETQRASQAISNLLELNYAPVEETATQGQDAGGAGGGVDTTMRDSEIRQDLEKAGILSQPDNPAGTPEPAEEPAEEEPAI